MLAQLSNFLQSTLHAAGVTRSFSGHSICTEAETTVTQQGLHDHSNKTIFWWSSDGYQLYSISGLLCNRSILAIFGRSLQLVQYKPLCCWCLWIWEFFLQAQALLTTTPLAPVLLFCQPCGSSWPAMVAHGWGLWGFPVMGMFYCPWLGWSQWRTSDISHCLHSLVQLLNVTYVQDWR